MANYIIELKNRFILVFLTWLSVFSVCYVYKENLLFLLFESELFEQNEFNNDYFIFTEVSEVFSVYIELCLFSSLQIIYPYIIYQSFIFISSGLFKVEYYYLGAILRNLLFFLVFSVNLTKYILIPLTYDFFFNFQNLSVVNLHFEAKLNQYLKFYIRFYSMFVFYFQIFGLLILVFNSVNVDIKSIKSYRKVFHFCFVLFATFFSPPDVFSQLLISLSLVVFYELFTIWLYFKLSLNSS